MAQKHTICPCGSEITLSECCGLLLAGEQYAATAEQLMRSRYSAYVLNNDKYLTSTWHPSSRSLDISDDDQKKPDWQGLEVIQTVAGKPDDIEGTVEFIAHFKINNRVGRLHEKSRFIKEEGRWYYLDGEEQKAPTQKTITRNEKIGRNQPCPCGSGKKYKRCCL